MSIKALQDFTFTSRYARYNKNNKRRNTWGESVDIVEQMHINKYPAIADEIKDILKAVRQKKVLGSQRSLQFAGDPIFKHNARMYNCASSYCDRLRFFQETMYLLLCGTGVGFSVQKHHIDKLPDFVLSGPLPIQRKVYQIPDSIEGWSDAIGVLLSSFFKDPVFPEYYNTVVEFDYSLIRPKGASFSHGVGKAPGPDGLRASLNKIREVLVSAIQSGQTKLKPIDAYDIVMYASDAVLSGGIRRSATLCMFSFDDEEMLSAKTGDWFHTNPQRGRSNNSCVLVRNKTTKEQFLSIINKTKEFGEPGFIWCDNEEAIFNPCVEICMYAYDQFGNSGWQMCNLVEINGKKIKSKEDFRFAVINASKIGTMQAGYDVFPYLGEISERIIRREALLGVSITGIMDSPDIILDPEIQREMAQLAVATNIEFAKKIGINPAARVTCVKPAGSTSCILGTSSGIHPHHARRYFRRVQENKQSEPLKYFVQFNKRAVEESVWSNNKTDDVLTFCIEVEEGARLKNQTSAIDLLKSVKLTQNNWVEYGTNKAQCTQPWLRHNVSNTVHIKTSEWPDVADFIYENRDSFAGISFIPEGGDKDYQQAPFCAVYTPTEIVKQYGDASVFASGVIEKALEVFDGNLWNACDCAMGVIMPSNEEQRLWRQKAVIFAIKYFNEDVKKMTYCLKDVFNWKLWTDLKREYKDIDYTQMFEEEDNTKISETVSCAGGTCQLI